MKKSCINIQKGAAVKEVQWNFTLFAQIHIYTSTYIYTNVHIDILREKEIYMLIYVIWEKKTNTRNAHKCSKWQHCMPPNSTDFKCNRSSIDKHKYNFKYSTATRKMSATSLKRIIFTGFYDLLRRWSPITMRSLSIYKNVIKIKHKKKKRQHKSIAYRTCCIFISWFYEQAYKDA